MTLNNLRILLQLYYNENPTIGISSNSYDYVTISSNCTIRLDSVKGLGDEKIIPLITNTNDYTNGLLCVKDLLKYIKNRYSDNCILIISNDFVYDINGVYYNKSDNYLKLLVDKIDSMDDMLLTTKIGNLIFCKCVSIIDEVQCENTIKLSGNYTIDVIKEMKPDNEFEPDYETIIKFYNVKEICCVSGSQNISYYDNSIILPLNFKYIINKKDDSRLVIVISEE